MQKSFAIVIVCFNRIAGVKRLISSLEKANFDGRQDITLIFSIDNSGEDVVLQYANQYVWPFGPKIIRYFDERQGLKQHILKCGDYTEEYDIVCILEDDIYVSDSFYNYAYQASEYYWDNENIAGISLYAFQKNWLKWLIRFEPQKIQYDAYFLKIAQSWGEVWQKDKWRKFKEWYLNNKEFVKDSSVPDYLNSWPETSWLKYHDRYCIENEKYFVYPYYSLSTNFSDKGEHASYSVSDHQVELQYGKKIFEFPEFNELAVIYDEYCNREKLGKYLNIADKDLCVDFWGTKQNKGKRYLISLKNLDYKIINSYSLSLRPIELSIINNLQGDGIYLYDTSVVKKNKNKKLDSSDYKLILYSIRSHNGRELLIFSCSLILKNIKNILINRIRKYLR